MPASADHSVPCALDRAEEIFVQQELSCLAAQHNIYLAANMASWVAGCQHCHHGNRCYHNTLVLFDTKGALVGVYHK